MYFILWNSHFFAFIQSDPKFNFDWFFNIKLVGNPYIHMGHVRQLIFDARIKKDIVKKEKRLTLILKSLILEINPQPQEIRHQITTHIARHQIAFLSWLLLKTLLSVIWKNEQVWWNTVVASWHLRFQPLICHTKNKYEPKIAI